jgi:predicted ATPase
MRSDFVPIKRLWLKRFRSILAARLGFENPLFLVGKNGAGKSNVLKALEFLSECMTTPLGTVFNNQGGIEAVRHRSGTQSRPPNMAVRVDFEFPNGACGSGWYAFEIRAKEGYEFDVVREKCLVQAGGQLSWFDRSHGSLTTSLPSIEPAVDPQALLLPLMGGTPQFAPVTRGLSGIRVFSIQPKAILELQDPDSGSMLKPDGSNLASVLKSLSKDEGKMERLCELLRAVVPGTATVRPIKHGKKLSLEFRQEWSENGGALGRSRRSTSKRTVAHEAFSMSDGTLRTLGILTAFLQPNRPTLVGLEEPESTIHPEALSSSLEMIRSFSRDTQVLVTTHSPELLDAKWIEPENLRVVSWDKGVTQVLPLGESSVSSLRDHLMGAGELLRSNALHPVDFFADAQDPNQMELFADSTP